MAQFIRINKESFASGLNITADVLIGVDNIRSVIKGSQSSIGDANFCTLYFDNYDGSNGYMEFEDTAKGVDTVLRFTLDLIKKRKASQD